jgi:glycosyltransferase involved in cell wall biosynthesis
MTSDYRAVDSSPSRPSWVFVLPWDLHHPGGVNQVVINLHREMVSAGDFDPLVMVTRWSALRPVETVIDGRRSVYLRLWSPSTESRSITWLLKWILASPLWIFDLLRFCRRHRVIAFNFHFPDLGVFPIALLRFLGVYRGALVVSFHGADLTNARRAGPFQRGLWKFVLNAASAIVGCSEAFADEVRKFAGDAAGKVHAIQNGLDADYFLSDVDPVHALPATLRNREFIVSAATWESKKGLDILLRAFADVKKKHPDLTLALLGRAGGAESGLRTLSAELGIAEDVLFFESVPHAEIGSYLKHAKAFCLPSRAEPFGIAILEAGAYRLPVVASRVGGIPEIITDNESGMLTEPEDVAALAAALDRVLSDADFARGLGEHLYRRVLSDFSWARAYQQYRELAPTS